MSADQLESFTDVWHYLTDTKLGESQTAQLRSKLREITFMAPQISFLGLIDTVLGSSWDLLHSFTNVEIKRKKVAENIKVAVQILAIDEDRLFFEPTLWEAVEQNQILEQIWMPGVHADVGGSSKARLLGLCSLFTMLERLEKYCPEAEQDDAQIGIMSEDLEHIERIEICGESRQGLRRFPRKTRSVTSGCQVFIHPIYELLKSNRIWAYGKETRYAPSNVSSDIPILLAGNETSLQGETFLPRVIDRTRQLLNLSD